MQFFTDPINYSYPEKVHIDWITTCSADTVKELITNKVYSKKLKNYISDARINP